MLIQFFLHPSDGVFPDISFGEFPGRVVVDLDQGHGGPHVTSLRNAKRKPLPSVPGPRLAGLGTLRCQIPSAGKYWVSLSNSSDEMWIRLILRKNTENIYDLEIGTNGRDAFDRFTGKFRIRGLKLSSLTQVAPLAPREDAPTLWDRLGTELDENS